MDTPELPAALMPRLQSGSGAWVRVWFGVRGSLKRLEPVDRGADFDLDKELQTEAYINYWRDNYARDGEAHLRRVGTLTKDGPGVALAVDPWRAGDVTWTEVRALLVRLVGEGELEAGVALVATDFVGALDRFVLDGVSAPPTDDAVLSWGWTLLHGLAPRLAGYLPAGEARLRPAIPRGRRERDEDYVSSFVDFETEEGTRRLRLLVTKEGARYGVNGYSDHLWLAEHNEERFPPELAERFVAAGFEEMTTTVGGYHSLRCGIDAAEVCAAGDEDSQQEFALRWAVSVLEPTGVVRPPDAA